MVSTPPSFMKAGPPEVAVCTFPAPVMLPTSMRVRLDLAELRERLALDARAQSGADARRRARTRRMRKRRARRRRPSAVAVDPAAARATSACARITMALVVPVLSDRALAPARVGVHLLDGELLASALVDVGRP